MKFGLSSSNGRFFTQVTDAFLTSGVIQEKTYNFIISGVLWKYRSTNFNLVEANLLEKNECKYQT